MTLPRGLLIWLLVSCTAAFAEVPAESPSGVLPSVNGWNASLDSVEASIKRKGLGDDDISRLRDELTRIQDGLAHFITDTTPKLEDAQSQFHKLGTEPEAQAAPEAETITKQREELGKNVTDLGGEIKTAEVLQIKAEQLAKQLRTRQLDRFFSQIMRRYDSPLSPSVWSKLVPQVTAVNSRLQLLISDWWGTINPYAIGIAILAGVMVWLLTGFIARKWIEHFRSYPDKKPTYFEQLASAVWVTIARTVPPVASVGLAYLLLSWFGQLNTRMDKVVLSGVSAFFTIAAINALASSLLAPLRSRWRIFPASDKAARRMRWLIVAIATVYGIDLFLNRLNDVLFAPVSLTIIQSFIAAVLFALLLARASHTQIITKAKSLGRKRSSWLTFLRITMWVITIAILHTAILGYIPLARFISSQLVFTGSIIVIVYLLHVSIEHVSANLIYDHSSSGRWMASNMGLNSRRRDQMGIILSLVLNAALILAAVPFIMLQWGFGLDDIKGWLGKLLFGFQIGNLHISVVNFLAAFSLFIGGLVLTRIFQRWLKKKVLERANFDSGAIHSIHIGIGYAGMLIAALIAISYAGIELTNIAIVAGALSVGIGFGLQSIINNFVSGLILLAERQIKVGDWIVVGSNEGYVQQISVRSTEIKTFDRSNIIIPNSELISGTVHNLTLRDPLGRTIIKVGVSYDSDPEEVRQILLDAAKDHPKVLADPAPFASLDDFGASSLDFSLRAYLPDINSKLSISSELRMSILNALREANIEIPFPQRDVNLRDIDRLVDPICTSVGNAE
jgi:small-conductance mechanosensitive channel